MMIMIERDSNIQNFLHCTTPFIPSQFLPQGEIQNPHNIWNQRDSEKVQFFRLADLWDSFDEWSAYGVGVPVKIEDESGKEFVVFQYFVPYLSAIQIFTSDPPPPPPRPRPPIKPRKVSDSTSNTSEGSTSEGNASEGNASEGNASEENVKIAKSTENSSSDEGGSENPPNWDFKGYRYFEYFEKESPYGRLPFTDKMYKLAEKFPGLLSLKSVDLSPASWMAIAWYPIYHIPLGRPTKDPTSFLTFHTLSSSFQDMEDDCAMEKCEEEGILLPAFGLATYKMQGNVWVPSDSGREHAKFTRLFSAADSWLRQLGVQHHDFEFFCNNSG